MFKQLNIGETMAYGSGDHIHELLDCQASTEQELEDALALLIAVARGQRSSGDVLFWLETKYPEKIKGGVVPG